MRALWCVPLLVCVLALPARSETIGSIPRPRSGSWSVDTTGKISSSTLAEVDRLGEEVQRKGLGQLTVVVVRTTGGQKPRSFATSLFNTWGIGHAGRDDGALLFIALSDRKAEIVLGDGVDGAEDTRRSDALMSGEIIPAFKRGDPNGAVSEGAQGLFQLLEQSPLNAPTDSTSGTSRGDAVSGLMQDLDTAATIPAADTVPYTPPAPESRSAWERVEEGVTEANPWTLGGGAGGLIAGGLGLRRWLRRRPRICEQCKQPRQLLGESEDDAHLDQGQRLEENLGSVDYDVWWCESCEDARIERYGAFFTSYSKCPQCDYKTKSESSTTLVHATYDHGGTVQVTVAAGTAATTISSREALPGRPGPARRHRPAPGAAPPASGEAAPREAVPAGAGSMSRAPLRFFFDYVSPYAYLAWTQLPTLAERHGRSLELVPVLFAGVLNALGGTGPAEVPRKRFYIYKHTHRIAHELGVPFVMPAAHPFNPLLALRVTAAVQEEKVRHQLVSALYAAAWAEGGVPLEPERVEAILTSIGLDARALLTAAQSSTVKELLRRNTEELLALEGFGVPTVVVEGELFFGVDSLSHLERFLRGQDLLSREERERLRDLPVGASRV
jgi:uncharacterized protein